MKQRRVVVTGLGALTPIGLGVSEFWQGMLAGKSGAAPITRFDAAKFKTRFACELKNFDPHRYIPSKEARKMDPFTQYATIAADEAIADGGLRFAELDVDRIGVVIGSGIGGIQSFTDEMKQFFGGDGTPRFSPFFIPRMIIDIAPGHVSIKHGLRGPNYACVAACATGTNCIIDAYLLIKNDLADVMVAGGGEAAVTEAGVGGFNALKALSEHNESPETASRPFDLDRNGFVLGEGAGALILEEYDHAVRRGARIYAELCGIGLSADAYHITAPEPEAIGITRVMQNALRNGGITPDVVDYINVHGPSTPLGDVAETRAVKAVFGEHAYKLKLSSTKSMIGHLLGAAGAVEAIATVLAVHHNMIPPTINHFTDDPECDLDYTFNRPAPAEIRYAVSNNYGFGGHNTSILFKKVNG